eukprot:scaffold14731_cov94-Isochrysis_galbana.AAC.1
MPSPWRQPAARRPNARACRPGQLALALGRSLVRLGFVAGGDGELGAELGHLAVGRVDRLLLARHRLGLLHELRRLELELGLCRPDVCLQLADDLVALDDLGGRDLVRREGGREQGHHIVVAEDGGSFRGGGSGPWADGWGAALPPRGYLGGGAGPAAAEGAGAARAHLELGLEPGVILLVRHQRLLQRPPGVVGCLQQRGALGHQRLLVRHRRRQRSQLDARGARRLLEGMVGRGQLRIVGAQLGRLPAEQPDLLVQRLVPVGRLAQRQLRLVQARRQRGGGLVGFVRGGAETGGLGLVPFNQPEPVGLGLAREGLLGGHGRLPSLGRQVGVARLWG